jgi:drug/metabolite transporter (DMT)-like permease
MSGYIIPIAFVAMLSFAVSDTLTKGMVFKVGKQKLALYILGFGLLPVAAFYFMAPEPAVPFPIIALSILVGIAFGIADILFYKTFETEQITTTAVLSELPPAFLIILGIAAFGEKLSAINALGMLIIFTGAVLVMKKNGFSINRLVLPAVAAFCIWTIYWVAMAYAISITGNYTEPIAIVRLAGFFTVAMCVLFLPSKEKMPKANLNVARSILYSLPSIMLVAVGGILDGLGNILYGADIGMGAIAISSAIVALVPLAIGITGRIFYKDRLSSLQLIGFTMMVIGAIAISFA